MNIEPLTVILIIGSISILFIELYIVLTKPAPQHREIKMSEPKFTYRANDNDGTIELFVDDELITTWSYDDEPGVVLDEFKKIFNLGRNYE